MTDNIHDNCYLHIRILPTHPHILSAFYSLPHPLITYSFASSQKFETTLCPQKKHPRHFRL